MCCGSCRESSPGRLLSGGVWYPCPVVGPLDGDSVTNVSQIVTTDKVLSLLEAMSTTVHPSVTAPVTTDKVLSLLEAACWYPQGSRMSMDGEMSQGPVVA